MSGLKGTLASGAGKALPGAAGEMASLNEGGLCPGLSITDVSEPKCLPRCRLAWFS
eukprot:SAG31_NODE_2887_length_4948_cov_3.419468_6_plen_56_part_00